MGGRSAHVPCLRTVDDAAAPAAIDPRQVREGGAVFGDLLVATAILDRRRHHRHVLAIRDESDRLREKRRSGLILPSVLTGGESAEPHHHQTTTEMPG
jgi:hypothetical protein